MSIAISKKNRRRAMRNNIKVSSVFAISQLLLALMGYLLGVGTKDFFSGIDHWIAFFLLSAIGLKFIKEAFEEDEEDEVGGTGWKTLFLLGIATSIDAFVVGITFVAMEIDIFLTLILIGLITFSLSFLGGVLGKKMSSFDSRKIESLGGIVLIALGIKILFGHLS
jgi:putative Mn2+ efflux pump MntP